MRDHHDEDQPICRIGWHRHHGYGPICPHHLDTTRAHLARLPTLVARLGMMLVPGSPRPGGKIAATGRVGSPTPADLRVLSAIGPGNTDVRRDARLLVPQVRRWSTLQTVTVATIRGDQTVHERRVVRTWHSELVIDRDTRPRCRCGQPHLDAAGAPLTHGRPVLILDDDQVGLVPPAEWCDLWVRRWRRELGHPTPTGLQPAGMLRRWRKPGDTRAGHRLGGAPVPLPNVDQVADDARQRLADAAVRERMLLAAGQPGTRDAVATYLTVGAMMRHVLATTHAEVRTAVLGLSADGAAGRARTAAALAGQPTPRVPHDAVAAEWILRYGAATTAAAVQVDAGYLTEWLPHVADLTIDQDPDPDVDVAAFAVELGALVAELEHLLGDTRDEQWIGRCPTALLDEHGNTTGRHCGAGLWHDPYRTRIECPRCHTATRPADWRTLAARIREVWPIDQRRRYTTPDRAAAEASTNRPRCRGCDTPMRVEWRDVTRRADTGRVWQPTRLVCPSGCLPGGTTRAA